MSNFTQKNTKENQIKLKLIRNLCNLKLFNLNTIEKNKLNNFKEIYKNNLLFSNLFFLFFFSFSLSFLSPYFPSNFLATKHSLTVTIITLLRLVWTYLTKYKFLIIEIYIYI